jgi:hypothetical protein
MFHSQSRDDSSVLGTHSVERAAQALCSPMSCRRLGSCLHAINITGNRPARAMSSKIFGHNVWKWQNVWGGGSPVLALDLRGPSPVPREVTHHQGETERIRDYILIEYRLEGLESPTSGDRLHWERSLSSVLVMDQSATVGY